MNKQFFALLLAMFLGVFQSYSQLSITANSGLTNFSHNNFLTATTISKYADISFTYQLKNNFFVRADIQNYGVSALSGTEIKLISVPFTIGTSVRNEYFEQLFGIGYVLTIPYKFVNLPNQKFVNHGLNAFIENRFLISTKSYFALGINTSLTLASGSSFIDKLSSNSALYIGVGFKLGK